MQQEGQVMTLTKISSSDSGTFNGAAYNGFGKPKAKHVI